MPDSDEPEGPYHIDIANQQACLELDEALELKKPVRMEYLDANQQRTHRVIEPLHVKRFRGELVLVAHCQLRQAQRTFKVHRIISVSRIEELPAPAPQAPLETLFNHLPPIAQPSSTDPS